MSYPMPFVAGQRLIELGGGATPYIRPNVDFIAGPTVDIVADLSGPLPLESDAFDGVFCSYAVEHISWRKIEGFLTEVLRILRPGGKVVFVTANLKEQARRLVNSEEWSSTDICMVFGDQDYIPGNMHLCGFSPESAFGMLKKLGYGDILILPHPNTITDMIIEANKPFAINDPNKWTTEERQKAYDSQYFNGGRKVGGYAREGYWDYPIHWATYRKIKSLNPESVLEIGSSRGYILKRLEDDGIRVKGLDVSVHSRLTRVVQDVAVWDITVAPWPVEDKSFDLVFSVATLEHIPADKLHIVKKELERVSKRGVHGIDIHDDDAFDKTHVTIKPLDWWKDKLPDSHKAIDKEWFEEGPPNPPGPDGKLKLNIGSFTTMFHNGWINMDIHDLVDWAKQYDYLFKKQDITQGLGFSDNTVDLIFSSHMLEHLDYHQGMQFLNCCYKALKPGSVIRIAVPDACLLTNRYIVNQLGDFDQLNDGCAKSPAQIAKLWNLLFSNHQSAYDASTLISSLQAVGFQDAVQCEFRESSSEQMKRETIDMYPELSLYVEAIKP